MASVGSFHFLLVALYFLNFLFLKACFTLYLRAFLSSLPEYAILIHFSSQYHVYLFMDFFKDFCFLCGTVLHFIYFLLSFGQLLGKSVTYQIICFSVHPWMTSHPLVWVLTASIFWSFCIIIFNFLTAVVHLLAELIPSSINFLSH